MNPVMHFLVFLTHCFYRSRKTPVKWNFAVLALLGICITGSTVRAQDSTLFLTDYTVNTLPTVPVRNLNVLLPDTTLHYPYNKKRVKLVAVSNITAYSALMAGLYNAWYKNYPQTSLPSFNDIKEWKQIDKNGHVYSAYIESKISMEMWRWTGIERKKRIWIGGLSGLFYQTVIETLDGFSSQWGWSWGDFAANVAGSGMFIAQELAWDEQRIQMKWSFYRKNYADASLNNRSAEIFGKTTLERLLKDYNGQTYWLSTTLRSFFPGARIPAWLQVSVGTGAEGLFGANRNLSTDKYGNITFDRRDLKRYRQWYLAPDIDLTKIKTRKKGIRFALNLLNVIKIPAPSLEFSNGSFKWNWLHF